jgi:transposase-like protein
MQKSPCITCDHKDRDKNHDGCMRCPERAAYVSGTQFGGGVPERMLRTGNVPGSEVKMTSESKTEKLPAVPVDDVMQAIGDACRRLKVEKAAVLGSRRTDDLVDARARIAGILRSEYNFSCRRIAAAFDVSMATVTNWRARLMPRKATAGGALPMKTRSPEEKSKFLIVDFNDRPELLERIKKIAADEMRTPEMQVLYWIHSTRVAG